MAKNYGKIISLVFVSLTLAGCQTVAYVPRQQTTYDVYGTPYTTTVQTPVVVDNTNQVVGAALIGGVLGLAAGAAISNNNSYYGRRYYNNHYPSRGYYNRHNRMYYR